MPHKNVPPEFLVEGNEMPRVADPLCEIDNPLHEETSWGDNHFGYSFRGPAQGDGSENLEWGGFARACKAAKFNFFQEVFFNE